MEYAYTYGEKNRLYLNVTNRCSNRCSFCVRYIADGLGGAVLRGEGDPDLEMLQKAVHVRGGVEGFREFIWCGFGEPTFRLDLIQQAASWLRSSGARIRLNTNGHACLIHGRDVMAELAQAVDEVSVSLNAPNLSRYVDLCRPDPASAPNGVRRAVFPVLAWEATVDFLSRAPAYFESVQASVVRSVLSDEEIQACRLLARSLGIKHFRVR